MAAVAGDAGKRVSEVFPPVSSGELHVPVIDALANDNPGIFSVNVINHGSIADIPDNVVVEGKALVNGAGIQLLSAGKLPERLMIEILGRAGSRWSATWRPISQATVTCSARSAPRPPHDLLRAGRACPRCAPGMSLQSRSGGALHTRPPQGFAQPPLHTGGTGRTGSLSASIPKGYFLRFALTEEEKD